VAALSRPTSLQSLRGIASILVAVILSTAPARAQVPFPGEVRQIVTLSFVPGAVDEAVEVFREHALPAYRDDPHIRSFRSFREIESSIPLDLIAVSSFEGMAGMDRSNAALGNLGIGAFYGAILPLTTSHHDQFIAMLPELGRGDPSSAARTAFLWYRIDPGRQPDFQQRVDQTLLPLERELDIPSATGHFLLSDGWHYLRILGFESLGAYQVYHDALARRQGYDALQKLVVARRDVIVTGLAGLRVR